MPTLKFSSSTRVIGAKRSRAEKIKGPSNDEMNTDQSKIANLGRDTVDMSVQVRVLTLQESTRTNGTSAPTGTWRIATLRILQQYFAHYCRCPVLHAVMRKVSRVVSRKY